MELGYGFLRSADPDETVAPLLVAIAKDTGYAFGMRDQSKGRGDKAALSAFGNWLAEAGLMGPLRLRADSEPSVQAFAVEVASRRAAPTVVERTPSGELFVSGCGREVCANPGRAASDSETGGGTTHGCTDQIQ